MPDIVAKWVTIRVRKALLDRIVKILQDGAVSDKGFTNISQFIDAAVRDALVEPEKRMVEAELAREDQKAVESGSRMHHVNMYDDHVKVMDNALPRLGRIVSVYFKKNDSTWCDYCNCDDCIHVQFAWELPEVKDILSAQGLRPPTSRP